MGPPQFLGPGRVVWVLRVLVLSLLDPESWVLAHSRDHGGGGVPPRRSVTLHSGGRDVCGACGGGCPRGPLFPVPRCVVRPMTFTAARAPHRRSGAYGMASRRRA